MICGAGIVGSSIAYHLTKRGLKPLMVERSKVAAAASGKAGGFLAKDWGSGPTSQLHIESFRLHEELAKELNIESFRKLPTLQVSAASLAPRAVYSMFISASVFHDAQVKVGRAGKKNEATWLDGKASSSLMDPNTAQVTPLELTEKFMAAALANGAELRIGTVEGVQTEELPSGDKQITGVIVDGETVQASKVVVAMGPWSTLAEQWFGVPVPMEGVKSTSLVYTDKEAVRQEPYALFCSEDSNGCHLEVRCVDSLRCDDRNSEYAQRHLRFRARSSNVDACTINGGF